MLWVWSGLSIYCSSICKEDNERVWGDKKGVIGVWADNQRSVAQLQRGWFEEKLALTWLTAHLWKTLRFWGFQTISILSCCHKSFHVLVSESTKTLTLISSKRSSKDGVSMRSATHPPLYIPQAVILQSHSQSFRTEAFFIHIIIINIIIILILCHGYRGQISLLHAHVLSSS